MRWQPGPREISRCSQRLLGGHSEPGHVLQFKITDAVWNYPKRKWLGAMQSENVAGSIKSLKSVWRSTRRPCLSGASWSCLQLCETAGIKCLELRALAKWMPSAMAAADVAVCAYRACLCQRHSFCSGAIQRTVTLSYRLLSRKPNTWIS